MRGSLAGGRVPWNPLLGDPGTSFLAPGLQPRWGPRLLGISARAVTEKVICPGNKALSSRIAGLHPGMCGPRAELSWDVWSAGRASWCCFRKGCGLSENIAAVASFLEQTAAVARPPFFKLR